MTSKEKVKLRKLSVEILESTNILSPSAGEVLFSSLRKAKESDIFDILLSHMDILRLYLIYVRFDREASVRDIDKLTKIIQKNVEGN